ncbi:MAG: CinA family protein [Filomicrobium sp.]
MIEKLRRQGAMLTTAESCTGGLIAACLTSVAGSSDVVDRGLVTYSNIAKQQLLGVTTETLEAYGAVSQQTAIAMAQGALINTPTANVSIAVTGIAGPGGGSDDKPVGLVHLAAAHRNPSQANEINVRHREARYGDIGRQEVRMATVMTAFEMLSEILEGE